ncbi:MYO1B protein [Salpingoeca rosetta]|uniref:MYO1B protein n=1 Tax=Salpingoeca rosetta (strain ATCC 50818 / BSB-021) TaxID=946362 RepID=F2TZ75_SALR5|nr:MYO1B protein [Salpingoeca rosetta]EGD78899.1 MYO1B protein [Salpingoeca rosetta]|eukprot:XP_004997855.1 MYO1B protein [Salpingoeca rosetta]
MAALGVTDNLASLENLDEATLLKELQTRFDNDVIYTYVGEILVSVNPFKQIDGLYSDEQARKYAVVGDKGAVKPHLFAIADIAFQNMVQGGKDQACVISGESGAGKTEAAKLFVKHLIHVSHGSEVQGLHTKLVQVNPLLEAFGNAQTLMNDNSSRFGKFTEIVFSKDGSIRGAVMSQYLLEKSRVVHQNPGEQTFHVFYLLLAGATDDDRITYALRQPEEYGYIASNPDALEAIGTPALAAASRELHECIRTIGFTDDEKANLWALLSGVLLLGNLDFTDVGDAAEVAADKALLQDCCAQLGLDEHTLKLALTRSVNVIRGEETERAYKLHEAVDCRNATAKALYNRAFSWIFERCNQLLGPHKRNPSDHSIGILDIFGFECFDTNSFEQLCINLANEQLQFFFNEHIFRMELVEYEREGIDGAAITYTDNKPLLDLFLKSKTGLIAVLDEESNFPRATDDTLVEKLHGRFTEHNDYTRPRGNECQFTLRHYAGHVEYDADGFLYKNRDTLAVDVIGALRVSENELVRKLFGAEPAKAVKGNRKHGPKGKLLNLKESKALMRASTRQARADLARKQRASVATTFKKSLSELMGRLNVASPHFIRCVKPNLDKQCELFDEDLVSKQLKYTGMLETTRIRREGFAYRPLFADFVSRYKVLAWNVGESASAQATCRRILDNAGIDGYFVGKTKVFLRYWHVDHLSAAVRPVQLAASRLQSAVRGFFARRRVRTIMAAAAEEKKQAERFLIGAERAGLGVRDVLLHMCELDERRFQAAQLSDDNMLGADDDDDEEDDEEEEVYPPHNPNPPLPPRTPAGNSPSLQQRRRTDQRAKSVKWFRDVEKQKGAGMAENSFAQWFHGVISRREAEHMLRDKESGTFLVRVAESRFGYSLSLIHEGRVKHFMINVNGDEEYQLVGNDRRFPSLNAIVNYHETHSVTSAHDRLKRPCPRPDSANLVELS